MTNKKNASKSGSSGSKVTDITIRMNLVGFGDSFLVTFHSNSGDKTILIDCGVHAAGINSDVPMTTAIGNIIESVTDTTGNAHIDLVVCTHRHQDHISGFSDNRWNNVSVGEVWMPWTEDPNDKDAKAIKSNQLRMADALTNAIDTRKGIGVASARTNEILDRLAGFAANASGNAAAMKTLHTGFANAPERKFFPSKDVRQNSFRLSFLPDVTVHILGPSRDPALIKKMNPPKGQSYFAMMELGSARNPIFAFKPFWRIDEQDYRTNFPHLILDPALQDSLSADNLELAQSIASWLDTAINGTSLVIMFEVGSEHLLFSGDAQWGTWNAMMTDPEVRELLGNTTFYKIGHHASHNGTPVEFCEQIAGKKLKHAMASVYPIKQWKNIPRVPLVKELEKITNNRVQVAYEKNSGGKDFIAGPAIKQREYIDLKIKV